MPDTTGPSLDQLNAWSTSIDALTPSLDDSVWTTRTLFEPTLAGSIAVTGTGVATLTAQPTAAATIAVTGTASAGYLKDVTGTGSIAVTAAASAERSFRGVTAAADIAITGTAISGTIVEMDPPNAAIVRVSGEAVSKITVSPTITASIAITATNASEKLGDAWVVVVRDDSSSSWGDAPGGGGSSDFEEITRDDSSGDWRDAA